MATRDSGDRQKATRSQQDAEVEETAQAATTSEQAAERKAALDDDIDSILSDIDEVLEVNAEEFVRAFVQKGGQ